MSDIATDKARGRRIPGVTTRTVYCGNGHTWTETWTLLPLTDHGVWGAAPGTGHIRIDGHLVCAQCWEKMLVRSDVW